MDSKTSKRDENVFKLFLPELLTIEELTEILKERCVQDKLLAQDKAGLVSLFKRVAFPLPQREFPLNYRGKLIMKLRRKAERKRITESFTNEATSFVIGSSEYSKLTPESSRDKQAKDRLKPPPDMIKCDNKRIRLNSSSKSSDLDNIVIIKRRKSSETESEVTLPSKQSKINVDEHQSKEGKKPDSSTEEKKCTVSKKISLKRNFTSTVKTPNPDEETKSTSPSETDKKHQRITWP